MDFQGRKESLCKETIIPADCQEDDAFHLDPAVVHRFNLLNLHQLPPKSVAAARRYRRLKRCRTCAGSLVKKASGETTTDNNNNTTTSQNTMSSPSSFRRTGAVCNCRSKLLNTTDELNDMNQVSNVQSTGDFKKFDNLVAGSNSQVPPITCSIPPVTRPLFTSFSDPISPDDYQPVEFTTPPLFRSTSSDQETPNSKKMRKFKQRMEEMMQWMGKVIQEEDDDDEDTIRFQNNDFINHCKEKVESENEESVCVNKTDKGSIIHFKCPCGGGYEFFLRGDKCFYRLT